MKGRAAILVVVVVAVLLLLRAWAKQRARPAAPHPTASWEAADHVSASRSSSHQASARGVMCLLCGLSTDWRRASVSGAPAGVSGQGGQASLPEATRAPVIHHFIV